MNIHIRISRDDKLVAIPSGNICKCQHAPGQHLYDINLELTEDKPSKVYASVELYGCTYCSCPKYDSTYYTP